MNSHEEVEILLVEDNPQDAELTIAALRDANLAKRLVWAKDGAEALRFIFKSGSCGEPQLARPRLVLLDLRLPKIDGLDVLRTLKQDNRTRHIPVVVLTSSSHEEDILRTYQHGANSVVRKPVGFEEFARTVTHLGLYWLPLNRAP